MSHIADQLRAMLAEVESRDSIIQDLTDDFRRSMLPKFEGNAGQFNRFYNLLLLLDDEYGDQPLDSFGPKRLAAIRKHFIKAGNCRKYINEQTRNVVRIFKYGVAMELVRPDQLVALKSLEPLKYGEAPEGRLRDAIPLHHVQAAFSQLSPMLQAMIRIQLATGCRPSEVFAMTPGEIDRTKDTWWFRPMKHKTAKYRVKKAIPLIGDAREAITPFLLREPESPCFTTLRGNWWNQNSYRNEIHKACKRAGIPKFNPYGLRHLAATVVREKLGLESARALLGHTSSKITEEHYAALTEREALEAAQVAPQLKLG